MPQRANGHERMVKFYCYFGCSRQRQGWSTGGVALQAVILQSAGFFAVPHEPFFLTGSGTTNLQ
jgi:hypothetical protein